MNLWTKTSSSYWLSDSPRTSALVGSVIPLFVGDRNFIVKREDGLTNAQIIWDFVLRSPTVWMSGLWHCSVNTLPGNCPLFLTHATASNRVAPSQLLTQVRLHRSATSSEVRAPQPCQPNHLFLIFPPSSSFSFLLPPCSCSAAHLLQSTAPKSLVPKICERAAVCRLIIVFAFPDPRALCVYTLHSLGLLWVHSDPTQSVQIRRDFVSNSLWTS
jgi:hypothetical protein